MSLLVALLADHPDLVREVGLLRWTEWGYDEPSPGAWIAVTEHEAGRDDLPVTLVALDDDGSALGAVGLDAADDALTVQERDGRAPWLVGLVVRRDVRRRGVGRLLVERLEELATNRGHDRVWVVTGSSAVAFYRACGWEVEQSVLIGHEIPSTVLASPPRVLPPRGRIGGRHA